MLLAYTAVKLHILHIFKGGEERKKKKNQRITCQNQLIRDADNSRHKQHLNSQAGYGVSDTEITWVFSLRSHHWHETIVIFSTGMECCLGIANHHSTLTDNSGNPHSSSSGSNVFLLHLKQPRKHKDSEGASLALLSRMTETLFMCKTGKERSSNFVSLFPSGKHLIQTLRNISAVLET